MSPDVPRWQPSSEADIKQAIQDKILKESHFWDAKRELRLGRGSANKDLATDLAAFAIDGGSILVGLAEDKENETFEPSPVPTAGMRERIESIARTAVDPPLYVEVTTITSETLGEDGEPLGYLLIEIPQSAQAPHQVDHVYRGRGDTQNIKLSDAEVARHHARRDVVLGQADVLLDREIARDPIPVEDGGREGGHLYLVAQPLSAAPDAAVNVLRQDDAGEWMRRVTGSSDLMIFRSGDVVEPGLGTLSQVEPRSAGLAHTSPLLAGAGRRLVAGAGQWAHPDAMLLDVEFLNNGGIRVLVGRATAVRSGQVYAMDRLVVVYVRLLLHWIAVYGAEAGYRGGWLIGLHVDGLAGAVSSAFYSTPWPGTPFDAESYREITTATTQEIVGQPWAIARRLVERFLWALRRADSCAHLIQAPNGTA